MKTCYSGKKSLGLPVDFTGIGQHQQRPEWRPALFYKIWQRITPGCVTLLITNIIVHIIKLFNNLY
jgi:hypothetical protein